MPSNLFIFLSYRGRLRQRVLQRTHLQRCRQGPAGTLLTELFVWLPPKQCRSIADITVRQDAFGWVWCIDARTMEGRRHQGRSVITPGEHIEGREAKKRCPLPITRRDETGEKIQTGSGN